MLPLFYLISHYSNLPFRAWEQRKFEDCFNFPVSTNSLSRVMLNYDKGEVKNVHYGDVLIKYPCILNIKKEEIPYITGGCLEAYNSNLLENGDLIFADAAEDETVGKAVEVNGITNENLVSGLHTIVARATTQKAKYFLGYYINSDIYHRQLLRLMQGSKVSAISKGNLQKTDVSFPKDIEEQQKIGSYFKKLDSTIALHQHKLDTLKQMKKGFSQQIFPENDRKKPKIRFNSFCEEWEQRKIGEYGYFYYGKSAPKWSVTQDVTTPCVRYGELYTKFGPEIDIVHSYTNIDKSNLKFSSGNEVLVPRVGENPLDFANCSWLSLSNVAIGEMISVYNTEQYPLFIAYYFRSKMKYEFAKRVEGGNVSNLYYSYLEDILISVPSIDEQKKIAEFLNKIDITINLLQNKLDRIKELKKAYLLNMFI
ncbi:Type I restriction-modification system, specificity subunit S [Listeria monocytogenes FSL J1-208]|uniref:restriction endonuclease subunit S n=1 Tax=Listeria monocytogenes TaxID=1639 RepID=UPI0002548894|nr:Type I restriction-modification system, specificity subunit S [Listeria monocytogenes FSL J1-208]